MPQRKAERVYLADLYPVKRVARDLSYTPNQPPRAKITMRGEQVPVVWHNALTAWVAPKLVETQYVRLELQEDTLTLHAKPALVDLALSLQDKRGPQLSWKNWQHEKTFMQRVLMGTWLLWTPDLSLRGSGPAVPALLIGGVNDRGWMYPDYQLRSMMGDFVRPDHTPGQAIFKFLRI